MEQLEERLQRIVLRALVDRQEEHLRVEVVEGALEVGGLLDADDAFEPETVRLVPERELGLDHDGVRGRSLRVVQAAEMEERQLRRRTDCIDARVRREPVRALRLGGLRARCVVDRDDERDPVALGDRLAQPAHETGS